MFITGGQDDKLDKLLAHADKVAAILPALAVMSNPFQSASSLTSREADMRASDFKSKLLQYYFLPQPPPANQSVLQMTCMVSKLVLSNTIIEATHLLPQESANVRALLWLNLNQCAAC